MNNVTGEPILKIIWTQELMVTLLKQGLEELQKGKERREKDLLLEAVSSKRRGFSLTNDSKFLNGR